MPCCGNAKAPLHDIHPALQIEERQRSQDADRPQHAGTAGGEAFRPTDFSISRKCDLSDQIAVNTVSTEDPPL